MKTRFKIFFALSTAMFLLSSSHAGLDKKKEGLAARDELQKLGVSVPKVSQIVLNQYLKKKKAENEGLYKITFVYKHLKNKKEDQCKFSNIDYRKEK